MQIELVWLKRGQNIRLCLENVDMNVTEKDVALCKCKV